jgi:hypothetical protein
MGVALKPELLAKRQNFFGSGEAVYRTCQKLLKMHTTEGARAAVSAFMQEFARRPSSETSPSSGTTLEFARRPSTSSTGIGTRLEVVVCVVCPLVLLFAYAFCVKRTNWFHPAVKLWRSGGERLREWWDPPPPMMDAPPPEPVAASPKPPPQQQRQQQQQKKPQQQKPRPTVPPLAPKIKAPGEPPAPKQQQAPRQPTLDAEQERERERVLHEHLTRLSQAAEDQQDSAEREARRAQALQEDDDEPPELSPPITQRKDGDRGGGSAPVSPRQSCRCPTCGCAGGVAAAGVPPLLLPKGWLVFHPALGVVPQEAVQAYLLQVGV